MAEPTAKKRHLVWFRHDLRVTDNKALTAACTDPDAEVLAIFIATPAQWQAHHLAERQISFIHQNLSALRYKLATLGIPLVCHTSTDFKASTDWLVQFCQQQNISTLFFNRQYELNEQLRDQWLQQHCHQLVIEAFDDFLLLPPGAVRNQKGEMYQVYTPFRRAFLPQLQQHGYSSYPAPTPRGEPLNLESDKPLFAHQNIDLGSNYPAGEKAALQKLRHFCQQNVKQYAQQRDIPSVEGTSRLSAYLAIGVLSPRQCINRLLLENPNTFDSSDGDAFSWLNELIWREFYHHLIVAFPDLCRNKPFIAWTKNLAWSSDSTHLLAWQQGKTGYPIVDAAMRQMNTTGWMHNRLRMISASFLVKDLLINWREGEEYFMRQLVDGNFAANNGGWQWSASTGTDASPWFRIFNPTTQGKKFDPQGKFIRQWIPELQRVPDKYIHTPHEWADSQKVILDYPQPIVDHSEARKITLEAFERAKNQQFHDEN
ncbi:deoxyribodipyrimidine photo-lyase [Moellerella wisconsensis]|uniref:Deoxyribodipyrimidine photo-lyase n=1 Tax=Moellerella wisconsensis TaxID=158849 RepID=A0A9Q8Q2Q5_9GAMM|nr:deoxyribodipyrimidine photo-lyase [Moellerella wisconsensis]UNH30892.1 deoxyribodipyrimidine photo-lyase [Moellerella wisconsensis]